ncbi:hypothetical protein HD553DRAFT_323743 [Filobasidium floriforme]|uniref:uncharacterized protein n=1 Tax=Filobasidium floriforme TaxID=5210 RepID=UPI001E8EC657|nr:uncharacterized protein HD553DRAFT_323743 [Filobasidium floriforme]KAH8085164.1 hypothetical protein HD553DRAFT_323743 [Filobasidium floriforme]
MSDFLSAQDFVFETGQGVNHPSIDGQDPTVSSNQGQSVTHFSDNLTNFWPQSYSSCDSALSVKHSQQTTLLLTEHGIIPVFAPLQPLEILGEILASISHDSENSSVALLNEDDASSPLLTDLRKDWSRAAEQVRYWKHVFCDLKQHIVLDPESCIFPVEAVLNEAISRFRLCIAIASEKERWSDTRWLSGLKKGYTCSLDRVTSLQSMWRQQTPSRHPAYACHCSCGHLAIGSIGSDWLCAREIHLTTLQLLEAKDRLLSTSDRPLDVSGCNDACSHNEYTYESGSMAQQVMPPTSFSSGNTAITWFETLSLSSISPQFRINSDLSDNSITDRLKAMLGEYLSVEKLDFEDSLVIPQVWTSVIQVQSSLRTIKETLSGKYIQTWDRCDLDKDPIDLIEDTARLFESVLVVHIRLLRFLKACLPTELAQECAKRHQIGRCSYDRLELIAWFSAPVDGSSPSGGGSYTITRLEMFFEKSLSNKSMGILSYNDARKIYYPMSSTHGSSIARTEPEDDQVLKGWRKNLIPGLGATSHLPPPSTYTDTGSLFSSVDTRITSNPNMAEAITTGSASPREADLSRLTVNSNSESPPALASRLRHIMNEVYKHDGIRHRAQCYLSALLDRLNQGVNIDTRTWSVSSAKARGINTHLQCGIMGSSSAGLVVAIMLEEASDLLEMYKEILLQLQAQDFDTTISHNATFEQLQKAATCTSGLILVLIAKRRGVATNFVCRCALNHHIDQTLDDIGYAEQTRDTVSTFLASFQEMTSQILKHGRRAHAATLSSFDLSGSIQPSLPTDMSLESIPAQSINAWYPDFGMNPSFYPGISSHMTMSVLPAPPDAVYPAYKSSGHVELAISQDHLARWETQKRSGCEQLAKELHPEPPVSDLVFLESIGGLVEVDERSCFGRPHHAQPDRSVRMLDREGNGLTRHSKGTNPHLQMSACPSSVDQGPAHGLRNPAAAVDACTISLWVYQRYVTESSLKHNRADENITKAVRSLYQHYLTSLIKPIVAKLVIQSRNAVGIPSSDTDSDTMESTERMDKRMSIFMVGRITEPQSADMNSLVTISGSLTPIWTDNLHAPITKEPYMHSRPFIHPVQKQTHLTIDESSTISKMPENLSLSNHTCSANSVEEQYPGFPLPTAPLRQGEDSLASTIHDTSYIWSCAPVDPCPESDDEWKDILKAMKEDAGASATDDKASQWEMSLHSEDMSVENPRSGLSDGVFPPESNDTDLSASLHGISSTPTGILYNGQPHQMDVIIMLQNTLKDLTEGKNLDFECRIPFEKHWYKGITAQQDLHRYKANSLIKIQKDFGRSLGPRKLQTVLLEALANMATTVLRVDVHFLRYLIGNFPKSQTLGCQQWIQICYCTMNRIEELRDNLKFSRNRRLRCRGPCGKHEDIRNQSFHVLYYAGEIKKQFEECRGAFFKWLNSPIQEGSSSVTTRNLPVPEVKSLWDMYKEKTVVLILALYCPTFRLRVESKLLPCTLDSFVPSQPITWHSRSITACSHIPHSVSMSYPPASQAQALNKATAIKDHVLDVSAPHNIWTKEQKIQIHAGYVAMFCIDLIIKSHDARILVATILGLLFSLPVNYVGDKSQPCVSRAPKCWCGTGTSYA